MKTVPNHSGNTKGNNNRKPEPYMLYNDRNMTGDSGVKKNFAVQDLEYLQALYPIHMKQLQEYAVIACDRLDYKNSPMYDEYPDRLLINQVCDSIFNQLYEDGIVSDDEIMGSKDQTALRNNQSEKMEWEEGEWTPQTEGADLLTQESRPWGSPPWQNSPWSPPYGQNPPWGPPPWGTQQSWGPPCGQNPPWGSSWGPTPPCRPPRENPPWGSQRGKKPPYRSPWDGANTLKDIIAVILLNEIYHRRCRNGICK